MNCCTPTEEEERVYRKRVRELDKGRGQTCPTCDATDSHYLRSINCAPFYHCDNCERDFYG